MCFWGHRMCFSHRVPLTLPVLKMNSETARTAAVLCCLTALGSATQDLIQSTELRGVVAVLLARALSQGKQ